jgi:hypothetical protein
MERGGAIGVFAGEGGMGLLHRQGAHGRADVGIDRRDGAMPSSRVRI